MDFNFETRKTVVSQSLHFSNFFLIKNAGILAQIFLYLFIVSLSLPAFAYVDVVSATTAVWVPVFLLVLFLFAFEISLFVLAKIKKPRIDLLLSDAIVNPADYNMADFLTLPACDIIEGAILICKKRRLSEVNSSAVLYQAVLKNSDVQMLMTRLGIDIKKMQMDLKNYLEKQPKQDKYKLLLATTFADVIMEAAKVAVSRKKNTIDEKDLLIALNRHDEFFKKMLVDYELKDSDVENLTLWLAHLEERIEKNNEFWTKENLLRMGSIGKDWASGFTVTLDRFSADITNRAGKNIFSEIIGHEDSVDELERVMAKSHLSNALIVGEVGTGRKSVVEALAQRCYLGNNLPELNHKKIIQLDMVSLLTQIQDAEKLELILNQILQEAVAAGDIILFIDNLDHFIGDTHQKLGSADISSILGKYLPMPSFQFIATTSFDGLHHTLEKEGSLLEYLTKIEISETSQEETIRIVQNLALGLEKKYAMLVLYPAVREIVNLTARYFPSLPFPQKAIDMLQEVVSHARSKKERVVLPSHVASVVSQKAQIPVGKMEFKEKSILLNLEKLIHERIVNQSEAVNEIAVAMRRARSGLGSKKRPMGVFLFLGPTGVGKTETAKALAQIYFGSEDKMIRLDMSEFQQVSDIPRLLGSVSTVEQQGLLTTPVRENPFSLILLDEIEKAHPNILNLFLQVFDEGFITDGQGRKVIFSNAIIICTSNAGAPLIFDSVQEGKTIEKEKLFNYLFEEKIFRPEFVNRFDAAVSFVPLSKDHLLQIAELSLKSLVKNLKEKDITFVVTPELKEKIVNLSYRPEFGAREMRRVIQDKVENTIATALLSDAITGGDTIEISPETFEVIKK